MPANPIRSLFKRFSLRNFSYRSSSRCRSATWSPMATAPAATCHHWADVLRQHQIPTRLDEARSGMLTLTVPHAQLHEARAILGEGP